MPGGPPYDVLAVDNVDVIRDGLHLLPLRHPEVVRTVRTEASLDGLDLTSPPPDVTVLDYWLGREDTVSLPHVPALKAWGTRVILYTTEEKPYPLLEAARAGIDGLCLKNDGVGALVAAIRDVGAGHLVLSSPLARALLDDDSLRARLTPAEVTTLRGLSLGLTQGQIAARQQLSPKTISAHVEHVRSKYRDATGAPVTSLGIVREGLRDGYWDPRRPEA